MTRVKVSILNDHTGTDKFVTAYTDIEEYQAFKRWCADMAQAFGIVTPICYRQPTDSMECVMGGNDIEIRFAVLTDQTIDDKMFA
jgi:hypothetical protein